MSGEIAREQLGKREMKCPQFPTRRPLPVLLLLPYFTHHAMCLKKICLVFPEEEAKGSIDQSSSICVHLSSYLRFKHPIVSSSGLF